MAGITRSPSTELLPAAGARLGFASPGPAAPAEAADVSPVRRAAAFGLDLALLGAGLLLVVVVGLTIARPDVVDWVALVWVVVVAPLYFALYHAFGGPEGGPGATPGQHELGLCVRDAETGERPGLGGSLLRSYGGLLAAALVLPLIADLLALLVNGGRAWHDRLLGSSVVRVTGEERSLAPGTPTTPELSQLFAAGGGLWPRALTLGGARRSELMTPVFALYVGLVGLATVLVPLLVADLGTYDAAALWTILSILMFLSGIYWTQAILVTGVEAVRTGERLSVGDLIRRASQRVNALTVALLLLAMLPGLALYASLYILLLFPVAVVLLARFALVVPAIVLEDAPVLGAFTRSWQLTRGKTGRAFALSLASAALLGLTIGVALALAFAVVEAAITDPGLWAYCVGTAVALLVASVPVSTVLTYLGCAWCLFYYDLRREDRRRPLDGGASRAPAG